MHRFYATWSVLLIAGLLWMPATSRAQSEPWTLPLTSDGHPDLQGVWANNTATPLERPQALGNQAELTEEELARVRARYAELFAGGETDAAFADSVFTAALGEEDTFSSRDTSTGNYNQFWLVDREFDHRTSLVVDPPSGRLPPLTAAAQQLTEARALHVAANPASSWTDRRLQERCVTFGMPNLFAGYNTYYQIFQTPDHVVILHEMIHDARIIPLRDAPHIDDTIRQWHGDARGYWDGDTLVVETRNFSAQAESPAALYQRTRGSAAQLQLVERFTRVGPDTLQHEFTVNDAGTYSAAWTAMIPLKRSNEPLFEYACHEGNIGMEGILSGHRAEERAGAER
jgi:hypothetical protein